MTITSRTTKTESLGGGLSRITRSSGNKFTTSYRTRTKSGPGHYITKTINSNGRMTTTSSSKTGSITKSVTDTHRPTKLATNKPHRSSSRRSSSSRSSKSRGDGGVTLVFGLFVALIAGLGWLFSWLFGSSKVPE